MKRGPRAFQAATIRAALKTLTDASSPRRFLVADEPGLGKTVVARGVLEELSANREEPLCVFYVCSNQSIARQNLKELAKFLPDTEQKGALATIDRPSLLPVGEPPSCKRVNIYSLTPGTALPGRGGKSGRGRLDERALIYVLLESALGLRVNGMRGLLRSGVDKGNFQTWLDFYRHQIEQSEIRIEDFLPLWRRELAALFSAPDESRLAESIERAVNGESAENSSLLIAKLRGSMACAALSSVKPDIVIFDEFQRFRDLLDDPSDEVESEYDAISGRVLKAVLGDHPTYAPGLLLLSATPYTPYRSRGGISDDSTLNDDFFELISFLSGGGTMGAAAAKDARSLFRVLEEELLKGQQLSDRAKEARESLQRFLSGLLSRTERSHAANGDEELLASMRALDSPLLAEDLLAFEHLAQSLDPDSDRPWAVPFWRSVPLPMQTLGKRYKSWQRASSKPAPAKIGLAKADRDQYQTLSPWPHPRLRGLLRTMPVSQLSLPWVRPSMPWWPLSGPWTNGNCESEIDGKALVFSQFLAVPSALAGLISYSVEAKWASRRKLGKSEPYLAAAGQSRLDARDDRPNLLELFHPSPVLASLEPLAGGSRSVLGAKAALQAQLRAKLKQAKIVVSQSGARDRALLKPWELLVLVESRLGEWDASAKAWGTLADDAARANKKAANPGESSSAIRTLLDKWQKASHLDTIEIDDDQEFNRLVDVAIESPAVVLARSLRRHWPDALTADHRTLLTGVAWRGLRTYLDTPWFVSLLEGGRGSSYAAAVRQAVIDGNLESVLDEHFWYVSTKAATWPERLAEFETALRIRNTRIMLHEIADRDAWFSLRCHVAAALTETRNRSQGPTNPGEEDAVADRPEDVRKAFNSPFWPHVLVTTSVGQEGLDFHPWCRSLVHWDLCGGPIDLEQREGRINRYAGLSIRRAVAAELAVSVRPNGKGESPWSVLATIADEQLSDRTGLSPWWVAPGAKTKRFFFDIPGSDVKFRAAALAWERAHYRLVLGMPDQADLLERVAAHGELDQRSMRDACLDLAAINLPDE